MFRLMSGNNGRSVYVGEVIGKQNGYYQVKGEEYDSKTRTKYEEVLNIRIGEDVPEQNREFKTGELIVFTYLASRKDPCTGTAEEVIRKNECIFSTTEKGNKKAVIVGEVKQKKWNQKHSLLTLSFLNLIDSDGNPYGAISANNKDARWMNVTYFSSSCTSNNNSFWIAENVDERLEKGDIVVLVARLGESEYNGKIYQSNTGERFLKVGHEEHAPAFRNDVREAEKINPADYGY